METDHSNIVNCFNFIFKDQYTVQAILLHGWKVWLSVHFGLQATLMSVTSAVQQLSYNSDFFGATAVVNYDYFQVKDWMSSPQILAKKKGL